MRHTVSIFGLGYVGSVMAACLASRGTRVIGVDVNSLKVDMMNSGKSPIVEPGTSEMMLRAKQAGMLAATADPYEAVRDSDISFICVGTPGLRTGKLDLSGMQHVCEEIGQALRQKDAYHSVVVRSTVLPGTTESLVIPALEQASGKRFGADFSVCVNPEFLREGSAIEDFLEAPVTVMGAVDPGHLQSLRELYSWVAGQVFETSLATAEMIKYSCNAFHALKVAFANEMATFAKELGVDIEALTDIFTADRKLNISAAYLKPGFAFGGSCLPKDLRAVSYRAKELDLKLPLLAAILPSNEEHIARAIEAVLATGKRKIGLLGLSFKPGTDDLRESPSVQVIKTLLGEGCQVRVWDANVSLGMLVGSNRQFVNEVIPHIGSLLCPDIDDVLQFAEAVLIGSNSIDGQQIARSLSPGQILINLVKIETAGGLLATANARGGI